MSTTVIINCTALGSRLSGIGTYLLGLLRALTAVKTDLRFIVYLNRSARSHVEHLRMPPHMMIRWTTRFLSPDYQLAGHALRLFYANFLALRHRKHLCFNGSQLEAMFFAPRQVVTVHDIIPLLAAKGHRKQQLYFRFVLPRALRSAAAIVTPSAMVREQLKAVFNLPESKIHVIPHGVEHAHAPDEERPRRKRSPYILYVGREDVHKNLDRVLSAFGRVAGLLEHKMIIVGVDGSGKAGRRGTGSDRIIFKGYVSEREMQALYRNASCLVFPSLLEGFGLPPLEAMLHSCPVVASSASCIPEVCGDAAYYVDPDDVDSIAEGMYRLATDGALQSDLIARGLERVRRYSWRTSAESHVRLLHSHSAGQPAQASLERSRYDALPFPGGPSGTA